MDFQLPDKTPSPEEASVIVWLLILLAAGGGATALYFSTQANVPDKAIELRTIGIVGLGMAAAIWAFWKLLGFFFG